MASLTKQVWEIIDADHAIKTCLRKEIVNHSALAKYLLEKYNLDGSIDGVISAIRRYSNNASLYDDFASIKRVLKEASITTKTKIASVILKNTHSSYSLMLSYPKIEEFIKDSALHAIKTSAGIYVITDEKSLEPVLAHLPDEHILSLKKGLAQISIKLTKEGWKTKGVLAMLSNELSAIGVNIILVSSANPYINFFIKQENLNDAHKAILRICNG